MQRNFLIFTALIFILEFYVFQAFRNIFDKSAAKTMYWIVTVLTYATLIYLIITMNRADREHHRIQIIVSVFLIFVLPKLFVVLMLLIDDILRLFQFGYQYVTSDPASEYPGRRKFLSVAGIGLFGLAAGLFTDGIIFGKYRHKARKVKLKIPNLPEALKGYRIVQISDLHSGSFFNPEKLRPAIELINSQQPHLVLFTGDVVNNYAEEFSRFIPLFSEIKARDGKFTVLGNHDYGHYGEWASRQEQQANIPTLIRLLKQAGFETLLNEHRKLNIGGEDLYVIGVENWGIKPFPQYGDLNKATSGIPTEAIKLLMSHDPSHFDEVV